MENDDQSNTNEKVLRNIVLNELKEPKVFTGLLDWNLLSWNLHEWAEHLGNQKLQFRSGKKKIEEVPQWERNCQTVMLTMDEFVKKQESLTDEFLYFDYKYMHEWFTNHPEIMQDVSWSNFGFEELKGTDSTIWIGSDGAHTPCHIDSYGCNLVAQVYGKKMWILFPPDTSSVEAVRVPYEESSTYCSSPHPIFDKLTNARIVTLCPGEVLCVPRHWWHYVENIGTAISINTWIRLPIADDVSRLDESLVKLFVNRMCIDLPETEKKSILNPNEDSLDILSLSDILSETYHCIQKCQENQALKSVRKRFRKSDTNMEDGLTTVKKSAQNEAVNKIMRDVPRCTADDIHRVSTRIRHAPLSPIATCKEPNLINCIINAFCHPDIIKQVRQKVLEQLQ